MSMRVRRCFHITEVPLLRHSVIIESIHSRKDSFTHFYRNEKGGVDGSVERPVNDVFYEHLTSSKSKSR